MIKMFGLKFFKAILINLTFLAAKFIIIIEVKRTAYTALLKIALQPCSYRAVNTISNCHLHTCTVNCQL